MKSSWTFGPDLDAKYWSLRDEDRNEHDNPDRYSSVRIKYYDRIEKVISIIKKNFPNPSGTRVGDFGCGQGNVALMLAESGYETYAVDMNPVCIEYSKMKHERGKIQWFATKFDDLNFPVNLFDAVVMAEEVGAYKPDHRMFQSAIEVLAAMGVHKDGIVHVAQSLYHDHVPAKALGLTTVWVDRYRGKRGTGAAVPPEVSVHPDHVVTSLRELVELFAVPSR